MNIYPENINELLKLYEIKPKYFNSANKNYTIIDKNLIQKYNHKYGHLFYDYKFPDAKNKLCNFCKQNDVMFLDFYKGYSKYCSALCSRKDASRISDQNRKIGTEKRKFTMIILLSIFLKKNINGIFK